MEKPCFNATVLLLAETLEKEDADRVRELVSLGYSDIEARRLIAFVPSAFARPVLERLGLTEISDEASLVLQDNKTESFYLSDQPEYLRALDAARDHFIYGALPRAAFETLAFSSAEFDVINRALNQGVDVRGGAIASAFSDPALADIVIRR